MILTFSSNFSFWLIKQKSIPKWLNRLWNIGGQTDSTTTHCWRWWCRFWIVSMASIYSHRIVQVMFQWELFLFSFQLKMNVLIDMNVRMNECIHNTYYTLHIYIIYGCEGERKRWQNIFNVILTHQTLVYSSNHHDLVIYQSNLHSERHHDHTTVNHNVMQSIREIFSFFNNISFCIHFIFMHDHFMFCSYLFTHSLIIIILDGLTSRCYIYAFSRLQISNSSICYLNKGAIKALDFMLHMKRKQCQ